MSQAGALSIGGGGTTIVSTLTGNSGGPVSPTGNNINTIGSGSITIVGSPGTSTLTTQLTGLTNHNVLVGSGTDTITKVAPGTAGVPLVSQGAASDPIFGTATVPGGGTGTTSFNINGVVVSGNTGTAPLSAVTLNNGQLAIGQTGGVPVANTLTAGVGISISNAPGSITISTIGSGFTWNVIGASQTLAVNNGYFCTSGGALSLALPAVSAVGDAISIVLDGSTSWTVTQPNAATRIRIGNQQTTLGVGGSLASTMVGDAIELICETANARWVVIEMIGNITVV
jgi:hypothetical protein